MTLTELAQQLNAELRLANDAITITAAAPLVTAASTQISFVAEASRLAQVPASQAGALLIPPKLADDARLAGRNLLITRDPKLAFARALQLFHSKPYTPRGVSADLAKGTQTQIGADCSIHPRVTLGDHTIIGDRVTLHPGVVIGDHCRIGADTIIYANVSIYAETVIGERCRIHSGTVIGADGFSFTPDEQGHQTKLLQIGCVIIEDDVEIGANCCIDRAGFGATIFKRGVKTDNLIQFGHNVTIGEDTVIAAQAGFSGGTTVGERCIIAGQIGTNQHISIGAGAIVAARAGVTKSVAPGKFVGGVIPAMDYNEWRKSQAIYARLPEIYDRFKQLEKKVNSSSES